MGKMNPIEFALRRPITVLVLMIALCGSGTLAVLRMKVDIFPPLDLPVIYVCQPYGGMDPQQMEGLLANFYEYHFLYINGIHHVESKSVQGVSLMKLFFHPGTDMAQALAETVASVNRSRAFMPPGTVPPFIMRFDTGSVPVGYLVLSSDTRTVGEIQNQALFRVRPMFASIPGVSAPPPFGGSARTVVVRADPDRLKAYGLSPDDVVGALSAGNTVSPSGSIRTPTQMPLVPSNALVLNPDELGSIPVKPGVFLRDVAPSIGVGTDITTGYALVNGRRAVYLLVTKRANASTLDVVQRVRADLPKMQASLPPDIKVSFQLDQSPFVTNAMWTVAAEGALAAALVGLMVLVFLRDWRSVLVVVLNIPLALLGAVTALWLCGQSINLMTLGGLALAVGILVDEVTVEVENIHTQMRAAPSLPAAVLRGNRETAVPRLLAMLCILAVFTPAFFLDGAARNLFVPLSLAVGFAMITSYLLSSTLVPVLCVWLLRKHDTHAEATSTARPLVERLAGAATALRWLTVPTYLAGAAAVALFLGLLLGLEVFPQADTGQLQLRLRAPDGTRIEQTEALTREALRYIHEEEAPIDISLGYVGVVPPSFPINSVYLWMGGPEEAAIRIRLRHGGPTVEALKKRLRENLGPHLKEWARKRWAGEGVSQDEASRMAEEIRLSFEPADIINEVMSFGSPTPVEVVVSGPKLADNRAFAARVRQALARVPSLRDLQYGQSLDYPTIAVAIDREKAGLASVSATDVARSLVAATASSRFVVPNFWRDPADGIGYQVQVEIPQARMCSARDIEEVPVLGPVLLRDVAGVKEGTMPGQIDRYNMRRLVSMTANIEGEDLGRVAARISAALASLGDPPPGIQVDVRGQVTPMREMFGPLVFAPPWKVPVTQWLSGLSGGLIVAVLVIFLLLTGYFQSFRLSLTAVASVPAVLAGVVLALQFTGTTLNIQSFMGAIMAIGVAIANAILLVTFAEKYRLEGIPAWQAGVNAASARMRPILMTALAMIAGMMPMALGLGEGGGQTAPLGRAVVGGLMAATATTLLLLPAVFALLMGGAPVASPSLSPTDPNSPYFDPKESAHA
jgi:multidrug efflux pump subunit AcrB